MKTNRRAGEQRAVMGNGFEVVQLFNDLNELEIYLDTFRIRGASPGL